MRSFNNYRLRYNHGESNIKKYTKRALFASFIVGTIFGYTLNECENVKTNKLEQRVNEIKI